MEELDRLVRDAAFEAGFDDVGIGRAAGVPQMYGLLTWVDLGMHAGMEYMARQAELRLDPRSVLPGARSVIMVLKSYLSACSPTPSVPGSLFPSSGSPHPVSRHARGRDYHQVVGEGLRRLAAVLRCRGFLARRFVDSAPVMEKVLAARCGLGRFGRNGLLHHPRFGSWTVLGGVLTDAPLEPSAAEPGPAAACAGCSLCVDACPGGALRGDFLVDARRCISYWTAQHSGAFPSDVPRPGGRLYGCDVCQEACPMNAAAAPGRGEDFEPFRLAGLGSVEEWDALGSSRFRALKRGTALWRMPWRQLRRNIAAASR